MQGSRPTALTIPHTSRLVKGGFLSNPLAIPRGLSYTIDEQLGGGVASLKGGAHDDVYGHRIPSIPGGVHCTARGSAS